MAVSRDDLHHCGLILGVFTLALVVRQYVANTVLGAEPLAMGPDADDWALAVRGLLAGSVDALPGHRFPLVPWLAAWLANHVKLDPLLCLRALSTLASALSCALCFALVRRFTSVSLALLAGLWLALDPGQVGAGLYTTAYAPFAAGFTAVVAALCGVGGWVSPLLGLVGAFVAVSSVNQGILCVVVLAPVVLWMEGRWSYAGVAVGVVLGLCWVLVVHPHANTLSWMAAETQKYLSGNIPEETAAWQGAWWPAFQLWSWRTFTLGWLGVGSGLVLLGVGVVQGLRHGQGRGRLTRTLAWVVFPLVVLVPDMASGHHLDHLRPAALALVVVGIGDCVPWTRVRQIGVATCVMALGWWGSPRATQRVEVAAVQARSEVEVALRISQSCGPLSLVLIPQGERMESVGVLWRSAWALPRGISLWNIVEEGVAGGQWSDPPLVSTLGQGGKVFVVSATPATRWRTQHHTYTALGEAGEVAPGLWLREVDVVANSLLDSDASPSSPSFGRPP